MSTEEMTSRERIVNALAGREVDRLPFSPFLAYVWQHYPKEITERGERAFLRDVGADPLWRGAPCPVKSSVPGVEVRTFWEDGRHVAVTTTPAGSVRHGSQPSPAGSTFFCVEHPLKKEEDYKVFLWMEEHMKLEPADPAPMREHLAREGLAAGMPFPRGKTAFQCMVEGHVGTEELVYALCDYPDTVETLWRTMVENDLKAARMAAESEYEYFLTWEDSSTQNYSPAMYDKYIGSEIGQFCAILRAHGKRYIQHACGHVRHLLPSMKANGVCAVESLTSPPTGNLSLREARALAGKELGIVGGIEPTAFLNLSMGELETYVEQMIADGAGGPFVLANADSCPPGVTVEKFKLVGQIVRRSARPVR
jgi:uroporphyrinogen-III decarboxylase